MQNAKLKTRQTKQNKTEKQNKEGKKVETKVPAKDGLMGCAHGDADQHKTIDRMRRQANTQPRNNTLD
jgi:hypothetical protein